MHIMSAKAPFAFLQRSEPLYFKKPHLGRLTNHGRTSVKLNWQMNFSSTYLILAKLAASNAKPPLQNRVNWWTKILDCPGPPLSSKGHRYQTMWTPRLYNQRAIRFSCEQIFLMFSAPFPSHPRNTIPKNQRLEAKNEGLERWFCRFQRGKVVSLNYAQTLPSKKCHPKAGPPISSQKTIGRKNSPQKTNCSQWSMVV